MIEQTEAIKPTCSICLDFINSSVVLINCGHEFCHSCTIQHLKTLVNQGTRRVQNFKCPDTNCQKEICEKQLQKYLDFEYFSKLTNKAVFEYSLLCPECRTRIDIPGELQKWRCFNCYTEICKFCKSTEHGGKCQVKTIYLNQVRTTINDGQLGFCPQCVTPFLKDQNCDHVTCDNPECCFEFCFFCSVSFSPIYHHGGIYHRTDCRNYEHWDDFTPYFYQYCVQCKKLQAEGNSSGCGLPTQTKQEFMKQMFKKIEKLNNPELVQN